MSVPTQVFQECWSGPTLSPPPPKGVDLDRSWHFGSEMVWYHLPSSQKSENADLDRSWHFGFELVWDHPLPTPENATLDRSWHFGFELVWDHHPIPSRTYVTAGVWRLIAVSPRDTVSFYNMLVYVHFFLMCSIDFCLLLNDMSVN